MTLMTVMADLPEAGALAELLWDPKASLAV